jgi:hypothetical protein
MGGHHHRRRPRREQTESHLHSYGGGGQGRVHKDTGHIHHDMGGQQKLTTSILPDHVMGGFV